jgi:hypothetical protein
MSVAGGLEGTNWADFWNITCLGESLAVGLISVTLLAIHRRIRREEGALENMRLLNGEIESQNERINQIEPNLDPGHTPNNRVNRRWHLMFYHRKNPNTQWMKEGARMVSGKNPYYDDSQDIPF